MKFNKILIIGLLIALITLIALPVGFAADVDSINVSSTINSTNMDIQSEDIIQSNEVISSDINDLNSNLDTVYVNGSYIGIYEDGTIANPYKTINKAVNALLNSSKTNLYIANGNYVIANAIDIEPTLYNEGYINIIGESRGGVNIDCNKTYLFYFNEFVANIYNLTIHNGFSNAAETIVGAVSSNISLYDVIFKNNYVETPGGILYIENGELSLFNCSVLNNFINYFADEERGFSGGISGGIIYSATSNLNIVNSLFKNNTINSKNFDGGFIYSKGDISCINSTFCDVYINADSVDGGIIYETSNLNFVNSSMSNININAPLIYGGFISCNSKFNDSYIINSSFKNSKFTNINGLIYTTGFINIINSNITNNYAKTIQGNLIIYDEHGLSVTDNLRIVNNTFDTIAYDLSEVEITYRSDIFVLSIEDIESIPSSYDLRDYGWVSPVKDQGGSGSCWTFASIAALESYLLKIYNLSTDLSENNMRIIMSNESVNGSLWTDDTGGNDILALAYLLRWSGAINESDDPFDPYDKEPKYNLPVSQHVQGVIYLPLRDDYLDNNQIKWAIMEYGALYTSTHSIIDFVYNPEYKSIAPNHAVAIVGWDDNYVIDGAPGPGAFIIKNSWGTNSGDGGYYYISYYAQCFAGFSDNTEFSAIAITDVESPDNYDSIYQYDIFGNDNRAVGFSSNEGWFANEFIANNDEILSAFGLYSYGPSNYSAYIYVNDKLVHTQNGTLSTTYQTVKLTDIVKLNKGDKFRIAIKLVTPNCLHPIAIEDTLNGFINATANPNESFVSKDGVNWIDLTDVYKNANVCLKAYTTILKAQIFLNDTEVYILHSTNLTAIVSSNVCQCNGTVSFYIDDELIDTVDLINGVAICEYIPNKTGVFTVKAIYSGDEIHDSVNTTVYLKVSKLPVSMTITQTNLYYKSTYLTISLNESINEKINLKFSNGNSVDLVTKNGVATYYVPFATGSYSVTGSLINDVYDSDGDYLAFKIYKATATITPYKLSTTYYSGDYFKVKVTDNKGKIMVGVKLTLKVYTGSKYKKVTVTTGTDGYAKYSASTLSIGKHKVIVSSGESTKNVSAKSKTNYITVSKGKTTVVAPKVTNKCGLSQYFKINVTRTIKKTPISGLTLTVKVYKSSKLVKTYSLKTASNGIAYINTKNFAAGTYSVRISSSNKYYAISKSISSAIVMQKQKVAVIAKNTTNIYGKSQYFTITATKVGGGKVISGLALKVKLYKNGKYVKSYSLKTNKNGAVSFNTKALTTGTYTVKVASLNSKYTVSSANIGKLIMTKYKTNILAPNVTNTYKKSQYFKVNVTKQDTEKAISGLSIVVKVYKGSKLVKTYTTSTNTAGIALINTKYLAKGTYNVVISTKNVSYTVSKTIKNAIKII